MCKEVQVTFKKQIMIRKNIFKWHRTASLIIAIPVIIWAASGFMHPIMTSIRPKVASQWLVPKIIDSTHIKVSLTTALQINHIDSFQNIRFIHIDTGWFYQVQRTQGEPVYLSTSSGKLLPNGDWLYAQYLARQFLEGQKKDSAKTDSNIQPSQTASSTAHDCCDAATDCVLNVKKGSKVSNVSLVTAFDDEYKYINRLLPVYKVSFERADEIRIYVETTQDRFSFAMDNKRAIFDKLFQLFHTWGWLDFLGKGKLLVELFFTLLAFLTVLMGIYIFAITKSKKSNGNQVVKTRKGHRITSISIALFTLMFSFSGAYHAFSKLNPEKADFPITVPAYNSAQVNLSFGKLQAAVKQPITNVSLVNINNQAYWQVNAAARFSKQNKPVAERKDLMKDKTVPPPSAIYVNCSDFSILPDGEVTYARYLAGIYSKHPDGEIVSVIPITKFEGEYGFVNKRLPVFKINYSANHNERFYIENSTGKLSARFDDQNIIEGYSFAFLHNHEFLAGLGKPIKDFSTMFWAAAQIAMVIVGLTLWLRIRKRKKLDHDKA